MDLTEIFSKARAASVALSRETEQDSRTGRILEHIADRFLECTDEILAANRTDLGQMAPDNPMYDRLKLDRGRIAGIAADTRNVAGLPSPLGIVLSRDVRPNGMEIKKVSVPFGVIGVIYEARPNVTLDVFSLCLKSGNACILKGGKEAVRSNEAIVAVIRRGLKEMDADENLVTLLPPDREATACLLNAAGQVDLVIPRGSKGLIDYVRQNARVPVIETGAGICHTYFDKDGDVEKGAAIIFNAKTRRVSVCNALDCLIIHKDRLADLAGLCNPLASKDVILYADEPAYRALEGKYPEKLLQHSDGNSFGTEFLSYRMAVKTADDINGALEHIAKYSSKHSEAIISENPEAVSLFQKMTDAACVYANVSTAFTDGAQFGFGAEIGISTQKLHARGPMALKELTTYKYIITGNGQTRPE